MDFVPEQISGLLQRTSASALPLGELRTLLTGTSALPPPSDEHLLREFRRYPELFQVVEAPETSRRWGSPRAWILARRAPEPGSHPSLTARMRASLRILAEQVDGQSQHDLARWERLLREEGRVRNALSRRRSGPAEGR
jgi:hypothetical protein